MLHRNQTNIIHKINLFFQINNRKQHFEDGYCHGLTLLWLHKARHNKLNSFYNTITEICNASTMTDFMHFKHNIEKFISHIEWLQNASKYETSMAQSHIEELTQTKLLDILSYNMTHDQIKNILQKIFNKSNRAAISNHNHTIGVYKKDNIFMLYDSNYTTGKHKAFQSIDGLKDEILKCLFKSQSHSMTTFPLIINVFQKHHSNKENNDHLIELHQSIIASKINPHTAQLESDGDLLLAAESGSITGVQLLLEKNVDPNQQDQAGYTPLFIACINNHFDIIKKLLEHNADPNKRAMQYYTPLMCATAFGLENIMHELLTHGADPLLQDDEQQSVIGATLLKKYWRLALILLNYIPSASLLSKFDLDLIKFTVPHLKNEIDLNASVFTKEQKNHFQKLMDQLDQMEEKAPEKKITG